MTLDDIKDKVPSSIKLILDDVDNTIDVLVAGSYTGYLYITPDGTFLRTYWYRSSNPNDSARITKFLSYFK